MAYTDDFLDFMPDTLGARQVTLDGQGDLLTSGALLNLSCYIEGEDRLVRDITGKEVVSTVQAIVATTEAISVDGWRFTLPSRFSPNEDIEAIGVQSVSDEDGEAYKIVMFP